MAKRPNPKPPKKPKADSSKKERTAKGCGSFKDAVSKKFRDTREGLEAVLGSCQVSRVDVIIKSSVTVTKDGRFLLPDDTDEVTREEIEYRFSVIPKPEGKNG